MTTKAPGAEVPTAAAVTPAKAKAPVRIKPSRAGNLTLKKAGWLQNNKVIDRFIPDPALFRIPSLIDQAKCHADREQDSETRKLRLHFIDTVSNNYPFVRSLRDRHKQLACDLNHFLDASKEDLLRLKNYYDTKPPSCRMDNCRCNLIRPACKRTFESRHSGETNQDDSDVELDHEGEL
jgi:hypothetical protein